jgi:hypothetical protein
MTSCPAGHSRPSMTMPSSGRHVGRQPCSHTARVPGVHAVQALPDARTPIRVLPQPQPGLSLQGLGCFPGRTRSLSPDAIAGGRGGLMAAVHLGLVLGERAEAHAARRWSRFSGSSMGSGFSSSLSYMN